MHVDEQDEVALTAQQWRRQKTRCVGGSWLFIIICSMVAARIYREDLPRVTTSYNRICLSLSKRIRHILIVKINDKRRFWTCKARRAHPITLPRLASLREVNERACVFFHFSSALHTYKCIESNPSFK
jgi:hypothetical protein